MYLWVLCDNDPSAATACLSNSKTQLYMQSEFMGMVRGVYDGKEGGGFQPGGRAYPLACQASIVPCGGQSIDQRVRA